MSSRCHQAVPLPFGQRQSINLLSHPLPTDTSLLFSGLFPVFFINQSTKQTSKRKVIITAGSSDSKSPHPKTHLSSISDQAKMRHQQTRSARQYARPGCCYDLPIEINDDEKNTTTITRTRPISTHTATWLEAKARDRWQATTTATAESTFTNTAMGIEEKGGDNWRDSGNRSTIQAESSQRCRVSSISTTCDVSYRKANSLLETGVCRRW